MHEYKVEITREGRWWMVHIPAINGLTQARRLAEAPTMAREYIALDRGIPLQGNQRRSHQRPDRRAGLP